jgi:hypothetical protein
MCLLLGFMVVVVCMAMLAMPVLAENPAPSMTMQSAILQVDGDFILDQAAEGQTVVGINVDCARSGAAITGNCANAPTEVSSRACIAGRYVANATKKIAALERRNTPPAVPGHILV